MAIWRDDIVPVPGFPWMPLCLLGITAGMIGLVRDQRIAWRSIATVSTLVSLVATGAPSLLVWLVWG
jgi:hypothetical protein